MSSLRRISACAWIGCIALTTGVQAQESATLNQFRASETVEDGFAISRPDDQGHLRFGAQLHLDYSNDPLVYEVDLGDRETETASVVEHQLTGTLGLSLGLVDRIVVFAGLPVHFLMEGDDGQASGGPVPTGISLADGGGLGDIYLGARARLFGERGDFFGLGAQLTVTFPTGGGAYRGDDFLAVHPELLFELRPGLLRITGNLGARITDNVVLPGDVEIGDALTFGLGITAPLYGDYRDPSKIRLDLHAQLWGQSAFGDFFAREETPLEATAGAKVHTPSGFAIGLAGGAGVTRGFGSPDGRVIFTVGYEQPREATATEEAEPTDGDEDGDGIPDSTDECPSEPEDADGFEDDNGCPDPDNDGDGVADGDDECPLEAEDADEFEDENGCPDPDNDGDQILDGDDECPLQAEDVDEFEDENGCPDPDNDGDGILDGTDRCPSEAGPLANGGCPDTDRDGDTVVDRLDNCPDEAGTPENQGCQARQRVVIREGSLEILDKVYFGTNSDRILARSNRLLDNVARVLNAHPEITLIRVEGHTDDRGDDDYNLQLSQRRAEAVVAYLVRKEVAAERLRARGFGEARPIETNDTREGRANNRRVEFNLGEDAPEGVENNAAPEAEEQAEEPAEEVEEEVSESDEQASRSDGEAFRFVI
ncbi:MAG: OmpA family protein [Myxococcota bacterium]